MCQAVRFADGLTTIFQEKDVVLLEVGPGQTLTAFARLHPASTNKQVILPSIRHPHEKTTDLEFLLQTLGKMWLAGVEIDSTKCFAGQDLIGFH
jgi:bacillaene synthase trans-acting acyltransferase